jgi:hypothetical protein
VFNKSIISSRLYKNKTHRSKISFCPRRKTRRKIFQASARTCSKKGFLFIFYTLRSIEEFRKSIKAKPNINLLDLLRSNTQVGKTNNSCLNFCLFTNSQKPQLQQVYLHKPNRCPQSLRLIENQRRGSIFI